MSYDPADDGVKHINVYSKGKTDLGRLLTNFAHIPFEHPDHGRFESLEGFWYWLSSGKEHKSLRHLWGIRAKQEGRCLPRVLCEDFDNEIKWAIELKIRQNEALKSQFVSSTLPFVHYYVFGKEPNALVREVPSQQWQMEFLQELREKMQAE